MPILNNINGPTTPINRKTISKVSLNLGERFKGELINLEGEEALILLPEGYKLRARIVGNLKEAYLSKFLFQLEDFKDGKVFLKIIHEEAQEGFKGEGKGEVKDKFLKEGIAPEDKDMAGLLLRHNIPLTKSNLSFVKSVFYLWGEGLKSEEYIDQLIDKYIKLKGDTFQPLKEGEVRLTLKEAFKEMSTLTEEDIIIFLENDIALSKENITGYKKLIHSRGILFDALKTLENKNGAPMIAKNILPKGIDTALDNVMETPSQGNPSTTLEGEATESVSRLINEAIVTGDKGSISAESAKENLHSANIPVDKNNPDTNMKLTEDKPFLEVSSEVEEADAISINESESTSVLEKDQVKGAMTRPIKMLQEEVLKELVVKGKELKEMLEKVIEEVNKGKVTAALEKELDVRTKDLKILNHLSKDYYYLDIPLRIYKKEYPLKLIIKDSREGGKTLDSKEMKLVVSVAAPRLGIIDGYLEIKDKNLKVTIAVPEESLEVFKISEDKLLISLENLGYNTNIQFTTKEEGQEISPLIRFFQQDNSVLVDVLV
ncbi:hypothetical protein ACPWSR_11660 [Alloiococcus sp. CFN-8]|uniref:hypothetical protein n=1 Tax=Alloiococcus sp. CFN-8 TaxID=3416081 RepID=UPI003CF4A09A